MRATMFLACALLAVLACASCSPNGDTFYTTGATATAAAKSPAHNQGKSCITCHDWNVVQMHNAASSDYNGDCIKCHGDMSDEKTLSASVPGIHPRMCPYVYQAAGQKEMNNTVCTHCHSTIDFQEESAGDLRRQVATSKCVTCHTTAGPGRELYKQ